MNWKVPLHYNGSDPQEEIVSQLDQWGLAPTIAASVIWPSKSSIVLINALMTATEAKAAALQDYGLRDSDNGLIATGTSTDAIILGVSGSSAYGAIHEYAGTATELGAAIGRLVYDTVYESVTTQLSAV